MAVIEVGLGGRFDATNVITPVAGAITTIGFDHQQHLGYDAGRDRLREGRHHQARHDGRGGRAAAERDGGGPPRGRRARRDAASSRRTTRACTAEALDGAARVTIETPRGRYGPLTLALRGDHQIGNAVVAVRLLEAAAARRRAGDGGRTSSAACSTAALAGTPRIPPAGRPAPRPARLGAQRRGRRRAGRAPAAVAPGGPPLVVGIMRDKDVQDILAPLLPLTSQVIATSAPTPRALPADELAARVRAAAERLGLTAASPWKWTTTRCTPSTARWPSADLVCVAGSIFLVGPAARTPAGPRGAGRAAAGTMTRALPALCLGLPADRRSRGGRRSSCSRPRAAARRRSQPRRGAPQAPAEAPAGRRVEHATRQAPRRTVRPPGGGRGQPCCSLIGSVELAAAQQHGQVLRRRSGHLLRREPARGARQRRVLGARTDALPPSASSSTSPPAPASSTTRRASWRWASSPTRASSPARTPTSTSTARRIEKLPKRKYRITKGAFTTCVQPTPRWELTSGSVDITLDDYAYRPRHGAARQGRAGVLPAGDLLPAAGETSAPPDSCCRPTARPPIAGRRSATASSGPSSRSRDLTLMHDWFTKLGPGRRRRVPLRRRRASRRATSRSTASRARTTTYDTDGGTTGAARRPEHRGAGGGQPPAHAAAARPRPRGLLLGHPHPAALSPEHLPGHAQHAGDRRQRERHVRPRSRPARSTSATST